MSDEALLEAFTNARRKNSKYLQDMQATIASEREEKKADAGKRVPQWATQPGWVSDPAADIAADKKEPGTTELGPQAIQLPDGPLLDTAQKVQQDYDLADQQMKDESSGIARREGSYSNRHLKPNTRLVMGHDVATGQRIFPDIPDSEKARFGLSRIRKAEMNLQDGSDAEGMAGAANLFQAGVEAGMTPQDIERELSNIGIPRHQVQMAAKAADEAQLEADAIAGYATPPSMGELQEAQAEPEPIRDLTAENLAQDESWMTASAKVYEVENGHAPPNAQALHEWAMDAMSAFNWKLASYPGADARSMAYFSTQAYSQGGEYARSLMTMIDMYDQVPTNLGIIGENITNVLVDPTTLLGAGVAGRSAAALAGAVAKNRMRKWLATVVEHAAAGAAAGAVEGVVYTVAEDAMRQSVEIASQRRQEDGTAKTEYDPARGAKAGVIGLAAGTVLGAGLGVLTPYAIDYMGKTGRHMYNNYRNSQTVSPMRRQYGAINPPAEVPRISWDQHPTLDNAFTLAESKKFANNKELKLALMAQAKANMKAAGVDLSVNTPEANQVLRDLLNRDARIALRDNANAVGWYDKTVAAAMEVLSLIHPELKTDPVANFIYKVGLAITSNGMRVDPNFRLSEEVYRYYKENGKFPTTKEYAQGTSSKVMLKSFESMNKWIETIGMDKLAAIMRDQWTVAQLDRMGFKVGGEWKDQTVRGAAIIGPKIGNGFFSNLDGVFSMLTMDRWFMRTWGRLTGTLIENKRGLVAKNRANMDSLIREIKESHPDVLAQYKALGLALKVSDPVGTAKAIVGSAAKETNRNVMHSTDIGTKLRALSVTFIKNLAGDKEAPTAADRARIRGVMSGVLVDLQKDYPDLTMADLQALLWYPEKRLYDSAASSEDNALARGYEDDEAPDYANAAINLARKAGIDEDTIQRAAENGRARGTRRDGASDGRTEAERESDRRAARKQRRRIIEDDVYAANRPVGKSAEGVPESFARKSRKDDRSVRGIVATYTAKDAYAKLLRDSQFPNQSIVELAPERAPDFHKAISESKANSEFGAAVYVYDEAEYTGMRLFQTEDGSAGFAIKPDGDIVSVYSSGGGSAYPMLQLAVQMGGTKLDAFKTILPEIYQRAGFVEYKRDKWNEEYIPEGWNKETFGEYNNGEPDIVYMRYRKPGEAAGEVGPSEVVPLSSSKSRSEVKGVKSTPEYKEKVKELKGYMKDMEDYAEYSVGQLAHQMPQMITLKDKQAMATELLALDDAGADVPVDVLRMAMDVMGLEPTPEVKGRTFNDMALEEAIRYIEGRIQNNPGNTLPEKRQLDLDKKELLQLMREFGGSNE